MPGYKTKRDMYYMGGSKKKKKERMAYSDGGVVQYKSIEDKVKKCDARVGMNTMK